MRCLPLLLFVLVLCLPLPGAASHGWADYDICRIYQDKLPPGLSVEQLPEPASRGAGLLGRYCTQCHNLPGPDRHSAAEWPAVTDRMFMLMEVSNRFGGVLGRAEMIPREARGTLLAYLERHAAERPDPRAGIEQPGWPRLLVLAPLLLLTLLGLLRWRRGRKKPCATV